MSKISRLLSQGGYERKDELHYAKEERGIEVLYEIGTIRYDGQEMEIEMHPIEILNPEIVNGRILSHQADSVIFPKIEAIL